MRRDGVDLAVTDRGGDGPPVILLHGLAGSSRELWPTADALTDRFHVLLLDQRGHGHSTRRPSEVSRDAFVADVVAVIEELTDEPVRLVGQSMGAHTAFLTASARPDLVDRLVLLEGHVAGDADPGAARAIGRSFASWPLPFADDGMFTAEAKDELVRRRPATRRADLADAGHDAHLDAFDDWIAVLRDDLDRDVDDAATLDE